MIDCYCSEDTLTCLQMYMSAFQKIPSQGFFRKSREVKKVCGGKWEFIITIIIII